MRSTLRKTEVKLDLLTDIDTLLWVKKELEVEYVMQFIGMQKLIANIQKIMIKVKNHHILNIGM